MYRIVYALIDGGQSIRLTPKTISAQDGQEGEAWKKLQYEVACLSRREYPNQGRESA